MLAASASDQEAAAVAGDRARHRHRVNRFQTKHMARGEKARRDKHAFFGHRHTQVADEDKDEDSKIAPGCEQVGKFGRVGEVMHKGFELRPRHSLRRSSLPESTCQGKGTLSVTQSIARM